MSEEPRRRNLGRGLSALLGDPIIQIVKHVPEGGLAAMDAQGVSADPEAVARAADLALLSKSIRSIPVENLKPGKYQPRRVFDEEAIQDLVESVREKGILQPILARPHPTQAGLFEIIAGERRWRASQLAGLHEVPVIVREMTDQEALEVGLIENLQRQDLSPLEEAEGYRRLMDDFSHTQEELAKTVGKSRSHVANTMRLLALPDPVKAMLDDGRLTAGHARAILTSQDPVSLAQQVLSKGLNVRQTEKLAQKGGAAKGKAKTTVDQERDADVVSIERDLSSLLGLKVAIKFSEKGGEISVQYGTLEQFDHIIHILTGGQHGRLLNQNDGELDME